ncbi:hypothetical protein ACFLZ7_04485 [Nanoarchaeota archaeon]
MTDLVACLSSGKGTWGHVGRLIAEGDFENIFLITNDFGKENFSAEKETTMLIIDQRGSLLEMVDVIKEKLKGKIKGTEVALNLVSGTGKEHMAILSALLKLGVGVRLIALTTEGIKEI